MSSHLNFSDRVRLNFFMMEVLILKKQSINLLSKPVDWFLYDRNPCHERVNPLTLSSAQISCLWFSSLLFESFVDDVDLVYYKCYLFWGALFAPRLFFTWHSLFVTYMPCRQEYPIPIQNHSLSLHNIEFFFLA